MTALRDGDRTVEVDEGSVAWLTDGVLRAIARGEAVEPTSLIFLLQRYAATDRDDLAHALGEALGAALARPALADDRPGWLTLFSEASLVADDPRLQASAARLHGLLREEWPAAATVATATGNLEACLVAAGASASHDLLASAIDELERVVGGAYRPGGGVAHSEGGPDPPRGQLGDQVGAASALLTAFSLTGRLPYSMLAEELMQFARRTLWDEGDGGFFDGVARPGIHGPKPFAVNCGAARVLCRLETLHRDEEYLKVAVVADAGSCASDAGRTLESQTPGLRSRGLGAAVYGIALTEWLHLHRDLQ